ncbi:hypothetical protein L083_0142 [Actinoplanes sp. N902-109]|nr:hypothetical protein L083_0142 [Actinoplanes sp. N902-109]
MRLLSGRPRLLALGEPTHGENILLEVRNDLFARLVEQAGYRTIAIESDCLRGLIVDDYVTTGAGTLDDVMAHGFSHGFGAAPANRALVGWLRAYNRGRPETEQVHFAGFDGPLETTSAASPRQALIALHAHLAARIDAGLLPCPAETLDDLLGADDRWTNPAAIMDPAQSVGRTPAAVRLGLLAHDLVALLDSETPDLIGAGGWDRAQLYGRTATGLLGYHYWLADTSPARLPRLLGARASMMTANLLALAARGPVLAFAHNGHLQRDRSRMRMGEVPMEWWSAGSRLHALLGPEYAFFAMAVGTIHHRGVTAPPLDTVEGRLYAQPADRCVVDPGRLTGDLPLTARVSPWFGYAPLDPAQLTAIDGIVFVKDAPAEPAWWPLGAG